MCHMICIRTLQPFAQLLKLAHCFPCMVLTLASRHISVLCNLRQLAVLQAGTPLRNICTCIQLICMCSSRLHTWTACSICSSTSPIRYRCATERSQCVLQYLQQYSPQPRTAQLNYVHSACAVKAPDADLGRQHNNFACQTYSMD